MESEKGSLAIPTSIIHNATTFQQEVTKGAECVLKKGMRWLGGNSLHIMSSIRALVSVLT
jgi:hypothetical protein